MSFYRNTATNSDNGGICIVIAKYQRLQPINKCLSGQFKHILFSKEEKIDTKLHITLEVKGFWSML